MDLEVEDLAGVLDPEVLGDLDGAEDQAGVQDLADLGVEVLVSSDLVAFLVVVPTVYAT